MPKPPLEGKCDISSTACVNSISITAPKPNPFSDSHASLQTTELTQTQPSRTSSPAPPSSRAQQDHLQSSRSPFPPPSPLPPLQQHHHQHPPSPLLLLQPSIRSLPLPLPSPQVPITPFSTPLPLHPPLRQRAIQPLNNTLLLPAKPELLRALSELLRLLVLRDPEALGARGALLGFELRVALLETDAEVGFGLAGCGGCFCLCGS